MRRQFALAVAVRLAANRGARRHARSASAVDAAAVVIGGGGTLVLLTALTPEGGSLRPNLSRTRGGILHYSSIPRQRQQRCNLCATRHQ